MQAITGVPERLDNDKSLFAEINKLVQHLVPAAVSSEPRTVVFTSVDSVRSSDLTCVRAAQVLATQAKEHVCVVDANFENPSIHTYFGIENERGFSDALRSTDPIHTFAYRVRDTNLCFIPSGQVSREVPVISETPNRLTELCMHFQYVFINAPSMRSSGHAILLGRMTDGVVLIIEANSTRQDMALKAITDIRQANVQLLGTVLTNRRFPVPKILYTWI